MQYSIKTDKNSEDDKWRHEQVHRRTELQTDSAFPEGFLNGRDV